MLANNNYTEDPLISGEITETSTSQSAKYVGNETPLTSSFFIICAIAGVLAIANLILIYSLLRANSKPTTFVQLNDGTAIQAVESDVFVRHEEVIKETTRTFLTMLWQWDNTLPGSNEEDPGFQFAFDNQQYTIPSTVYWASQLIEGSISTALLSEIVQQIPQNIFETGESDLHVQFLSTPRKVGRDLYEIDVIATHSLRIQGQLDKKTILKKTFVWQAVLPYLPLTQDDTTSAMRRLLMNLQQSGLVLVEAKPYNP
ncbi:hypothetical protein [Crocosphaera chwakensis]|uniref:Uncharacterized protein n=1 Tax=Crocosphaera chwakensis CCY0110 TaxID=391612 RepID=A3IZA6_9CHRO|nr:hypothetical protein [Crocosphaera chwakensis]EAZ88197.1 hypothetical protein CY0110_14690 [Crocosphaera chwakensis CCY0110]